MFRRKDDVSKSPFPTSHSGRDAESYDDLMDRLQSMYNDAEQEAFWSAIDSTPERWQRRPEFMLVKALGLMREGDEPSAKQLLAEIERTHPNYPPVHFYQAILYMQELFPAHVLRIINKIRNMGTLDDESQEELSVMEEASRELLMTSARELNVPLERMEKASWYHEAAQEKMNVGQWSVSEQMTREALRVIPNWVSPRNNRSYVLYFIGRVNEAIAEAGSILAQYPDNLHTLKNLIIFHTGLGEDEKAREYSTRMTGHLETLPPDADEVDMIILVLGLLQDEEKLWALAQKYLNSDMDTLMETSWYALGVAAIRRGRLKEAVKLLEKIESIYPPAAPLAMEARKSRRTGKPLQVKPALPGAVLLLPAAVINEMTEIMGKHTAEELPRHVQKKLEEYIQKKPFVVNGLFRLLTEPQASEIIPGLLLALNQPQVDARLRAFALGDVGTKQQRLNVLSALTQAGREVPPSPIRFWDEEIGEWRDVDFTSQTLSDDIELNISPKASLWAQKAQDAKDVSEKIGFWRKAVEVDPKSGYAVHMLGVLLVQNGQKEEGQQVARRAIEVDPGYIFAYANLALMEAQEENPNHELIQEYLDKVAKAPVITTQTAFMMHFTLMLEAFRREEFEVARTEYQIAFELYPENPLLEGWDVRLKFGEVLAGGWLTNWLQESYQRAHDKAMRTKLNADSGASVTLNSLSRDVLGAVARLWGLTAYGKKAELVKKIVEQMQDRGAVQRVCNELSPAQKDALQWTLQMGGWRGWNEFTEKYGDDAEESPHWNYHEPESVVGCLRRSGFLAKGTLNSEPVVFIPADVRASLKAALQ